MIKFDDDETSRLLKKKKHYLNISYLTFGVMIVAAVAAAVLARNIASKPSDMGLQIAVLCIAALFLVAFVCVTVFFVLPTNKKLNFAVCKNMANGLLSREDILKGGGKIEFVADYGDDVLTLSRKGYTGAVTIDPSRPVTAENLGSAGAKIEFGLKSLKAVPALYATAGTRLWTFLQAYYALHGKENGAENVSITDNMGKTPLTLQIFADGVPEKKTDKNYFIKKGLVK